MKIKNLTLVIEAFMKDYKEQHYGQSPTIRQIARRYDVSESVISYHLEKLIKKGSVVRIEREGGYPFYSTKGKWIDEAELEKRGYKFDYEEKTSA